MTSKAGESREVFLDRIRGAIGRSKTVAPAQPAPAVDEQLARLGRADDDLVAMFTQRAESVGMVVHRVGSDAAMAKVVQLLQERQAGCVGVAAGQTGAQLNLSQALEQAGIEQADWQSSPGVSGQYELGAGITDVHAALAETGTLVCSSGRAHSRGLSLVPPVHVALVRRSDILPDMIDYWQRLAGIDHTDLPSSTAFITGPSKTADIEGQLITGVHGPGQVHIILIEDA